jgi:type II secretory pathway component PulF
MPLFAYTAVDAQGKTHQGTLEANNASDAAAAVKKKGQFLNHDKIVQKFFFNHFK